MGQPAEDIMAHLIRSLLERWGVMGLGEDDLQTALRTSRCR
jgi:hypothetical protein